jgi:hypothetical protein
MWVPKDKELDGLEFEAQAPRRGKKWGQVLIFYNSGPSKRAINNNFGIETLVSGYKIAPELALAHISA